MCIEFYIKNMFFFANFPKNTFSVERQGQETFLAPSAGKKICNYDTECSHHHSS